MRFMLIWIMLAVGIVTIAGADVPDAVDLPGLSGQVKVHYDTYGIPHIYAASWTDAYRVLGYIHASERLWQMDLYRRRASGTLAGIQGEGALEEDILMRRLGVRRGCQEVWDSSQVPNELRAELEAYTAGVNARMTEYGNNLPPFFDTMGYRPEPWTPVDCLVFLKYMGWDQSGTDDDLWFGTVVEKLGIVAVQELWPLERPYEEPTVTVQRDRTQLEGIAVSALEGRAAAFQAARAMFPASRWLGDTECFGSNNWAVSGSRTASGKPMLCSDPHLGFQLPSIWYAAHLSVGSRNIVGVGWPGCPLTIIGHNDFLGWGITNLQADAVDYFIETVDAADPLRYRHRGEWKRMERITEEIPVRGGEAYTLHIDSTVHGPIISCEGAAIAMQWTGLGGTRETIGIWKMNRATDLEQWLAGVGEITVPGLNLDYADVHGNIALACCGRFPLRMRGEGRVPMDGASGEHDWTGMIPVSEMPLSVNPPEGYVASANGRPTPVGYPHYLGWMWDPSYRKRRIDAMLSKTNDLTLEQMKAVHYDHYDLAAERFLPAMLTAVKEDDVVGAFAGQVLSALKDWDYVADVEAVQPVLWLRWLDHYRKAVWDDEWAHWGLKKVGGSWGFTGINHREPILEVLEYMTREHPDSIWFDDRATPERETRDDIAVKSFQTAMASIEKNYGEDLAACALKNFNVLKANSLTGDDALSRTSLPVPGTMFTVNPAKGSGTVSGGASWRMIVDFGDPSTSVGVYPGGQSAYPDDPHYADLMPLWARGEYVRLTMVSEPGKLPSEAVSDTTVFRP